MCKCNWKVQINTIWYNSYKICLFYGRMTCLFMLIHFKFGPKSHAARTPVKGINYCLGFIPNSHCLVTNWIKYPENDSKGREQCSQSGGETINTFPEYRRTSALVLSHLKGSAPSECMMAVWVRRVAASLYTRLHTGHGRGSWNASLRDPGPELWSPLSVSEKALTIQQILLLLSYFQSLGIIFYVLIACSATCLSLAAAVRMLANWFCELLPKGPVTPAKDEDLRLCNFSRASNWLRSAEKKLEVSPEDGMLTGQGSFSFGVKFPARDWMRQGLSGNWERILCSIGWDSIFIFLSGVTSSVELDELGRLPACVGRVGNIGLRFKAGGLGVRSDDLRSKYVGDMDARTFCGTCWDFGASSLSVFVSVLTILDNASISLERPKVTAMSVMAGSLAAVMEMAPV